MGELLAMHEPPTAAFVASDLAAMGALQALWEHGRRVPDDLSLIGFDDTLAESASPPMTTVALPMWEMGAAAVDFMARRAGGTAGDGPQRVVLPTRLVVRASAAPVAANVRSAA
jgi:LacI family transcriptional regulator